MTTKRFSAGSTGALVGILGLAGIAHFVIPKPFDSLVPKWMPGSPRLTTYVSGAVELGTAVLVANPKTRRVGGLLAMATFIGVFPANVQAALDGGMKEFSPPFNSPLAAWLRLPFQAPMIWLAWQVAKGSRQRSSI
jgi:uncharacterized membrane protein